MKKIILLTVILFAANCTILFAQTDTTVLRGKEAKDLMRQINIDTTVFLRGASEDACKCIDSIASLSKKHDEYIAGIGDCIDNEVTSYLMAMKIYHSMVDTGDTRNIIFNTDKKSTEYQTAYYDIERWLKDSCNSLNKLVASNDDPLEKSLSTDSKAIKFYNDGIKELEKDNFKDALPYFEKAVRQDPNFAFAWDNVGVCNRQLGNYDKAIEAYKKSLAIEPKGKLALQNIPVAYEYKKDYEKALEAYLNILKYYPEDPEADYGAGRVYLFYKNDDEKALQYMCKAYNAYVTMKSPYRSDAEKQISYIYGKMKAAGKEEQFNKILKENNISTQ